MTVQATEYVPMARFPSGHQVLELPGLRVVDYYGPVRRRSVRRGC